MKVDSGLEQTARIQPEERDHYLRLESEKWGSDLSSDRWERETDPKLHYKRVFPVHQDLRGDPTELEELILPFPSAPIYGINRKAEYGKPLEHRPNMHSVRFLRRPNTRPIHRLFILHNGLNEADDLKFYYQLADWVMRQQEAIPGEGGALGEEGVACLVVPFPGHLMHASFHGPFSETPLSRYLSDAGDLFRQFLKYMVGMRWLLSSIVDSDAQDWMVGGGLLNQGERGIGLTEESEALYDMSARRIARTEEMERYESKDSPSKIHPAFDIGEKTTDTQVLDSIELLRTALERDSSQTPGSLRVHVVGYSLGGFIAQSVFFAWPQVVSSCTTICSGGAISALSPTAFAQPEEWQSVLHALRPEITNSMLQGRLGDDEGHDRKPPAPVDTVAGMPLKQYGYFQRVFEQVFLQEDRGSYKERLSEYGLRMLFVSGGEDPIVPPANILDASPREGTTMLSVAGMTHFLNVDPKDDGHRREKEQRDFWLPEAGGLIARAAIHAEQVHSEERKEASRLKAKRKRPPNKESSSSLLTNGFAFEDALDWVLEAVTKDTGWLLLCRNVIPAAFLPSSEFTTWGTGLHHHDLRIQRYTLGLRHRASMLRKIKDRTTLVVPKQLHHWFVDLSARFDPHSDSPEGRITTKKDRIRIWREFEKEWWSCIRHFEAGNVGEAQEPEAIKPAKLAAAIGAWTEAEQRYLEATHLPDVWIGIRADSELMGVPTGERDVFHRSIIEGAEQVLNDLKREREDHKKATPPSGRKKPVYTFKRNLEKDLARERIRIVQISAAEFNPRYRGKKERGQAQATRLLARSAVGLIRSLQIPEPTLVQAESNE